MSPGLFPHPCPPTFILLPTSSTPEHCIPLDLWISPGSSPDLPLPPMDTHLWVFPSSFPLTSFSSLFPLLPSHHVFPYLASLLSLIPCITISFFSQWLILSMLFVFFLTHWTPLWLIPHDSWLYPFIYKPLAQSLYFLSYSYSGIHSTQCLALTMLPLGWSSLESLVLQTQLLSGSSLKFS